MVHDSEVHAYGYILQKLRVKDSGWEKSQILTQNELLRNDELARLLKTTKKGTKTPENIVQVKEDIFYVIEAKSTRKKWKEALSEAKNEYAQKINKSKTVRASFITGLGGNEDEGYFVRSQYLKNGKWETVTENNVEVPDILTKKQILEIIDGDNPNLEDREISDEEFFNVAAELNRILHANGILKEKRAMFIAAILLAVLEGSKIDYSEKASLLVPSINHRIEILLKQHGKSDFTNYIKLDIPTGSTNHIKYKNAIIKTMQRLNSLNIAAAIESDRDIVGQFYEAFLKYGNGAKDLGIVFTPRHITRFASEVIDVNENDLIFDPTCGTGGFLVAAYDKVKKKSLDKEHFEKFKRFALYGIEDKDLVTSLAIVNMIFRKDGKTHIKVGDCSKYNLNSKKFDDCIGAEYIEDLDMQRIPPITLLNENTLLSVVTFPPQLFQPQAGTNTIGIILKRGIPHKKDKNVLWVRCIHDGHRLKKGKRLPYPDEPDDFQNITPLVKSFIKNSSMLVDNAPELQKACPINFDDDDFELIPEKYLDSKPLTKNEILLETERAIREHVSFNLKYEKELKKIRKVKMVKLDELFFIDYGDRKIHSKEHLEKGSTLVISSQGTDNGCYGFFDIQPNYDYVISLPSTGSVGEASVQLHPCDIDDNCLVLTPKNKFSVEYLFYITQVAL